MPSTDATAGNGCPACSGAGTTRTSGPATQGVRFNFRDATTRPFCEVFGLGYSRQSGMRPGNGVVAFMEFAATPSIRQFNQQP
jgi:hypothetical protein